MEPDVRVRVTALQEMPAARRGDPKTLKEL